MPFGDGTFDVVFCQQGLQFFPDRPAALREMHRVLAPEGRLALSVLRSIEHNPGYAALAEVLERHAGTDAGVMMRSPFPSLSTDELRELVKDAGFREVRIRLGIGSARFASVEEFLRQEAASSPLAGPLGALNGDVREAMIHDLGRVLQAYTDDDGIIFPIETYIASTRR